MTEILDGDRRDPGEGPPPPPEVEITKPDERALPGKPFVRPSRLTGLLAVLVALGIWQGPALLLVIAAIVVMIFFHELGHYLAARRAGMQVTEFFIGFGPRIWSFERGGVEYGMKAIMVGAYVKITGMSSLEEVPPEDEDRTYRQKTYPQRMLVAVAGSGMHFIMAFVLLFVAFFAVGGTDATHWGVDKALSGSAAQRAGIQPGDRITSVAGVKVSTQSEMGVETRRHPGETVEMGIDRDGRELTKTVTLGSRMNIYGTVGEDLVLFSSGSGNVLVSASAKHGVLYDAGLVDGDEVHAINGTKVSTLDEARAVVGRATSGALQLDYSRPGEDTVRHTTVELGSAIEASPAQGFFGVGEKRVPQRLGVLKAVPKAAESFGEIASASTVGLARFFTPVNVGRFVSRVVHTAPGETHQSTTPESATATSNATVERESNRMISIVGASAIGAQITKGGWGDFLVFLANLNIVIGIFNLVPLPPFDGGHVAIATYEKIRELFRRDGKRYFADFNKLLPVAYAVVMVLVVVGTMAIYLDLADPVKL